MNIEITSRHARVTPEVEDYARKRVDRLTKFVRPEARVELVLDHEHERFHAELIVAGQRGPVVIGHVQHETAKSAIDLVVDKVNHQLAKVRDRKKHRRGESMAGESHPEGGSSSDGEPSIEDVVGEE